MTATPARADLIFIAPAHLTLYFGAGIDAGTTTTVKLLLVGADGTQTQLGEDRATGTLATPGGVQTFSFDTNGTIVREGTWAALRINVEGATGAIQIDYGSRDAPSSFATQLILLDTDGDGFDDASERRAGTDPFDASDFPGSVDNDGDGLGDEWEEENFGDLSQGPTGDADGDGTNNFEQFVEDTRPVDDGGFDYLEALLGTLFLVACAVLVVFGLLRRFPA
ncbi:MAG: thrombospondin type 3 repeat-containing protein [Thermoplasmatota archaeon]